MHDALTRLPNRVMLRTRTAEALATISSGGPFALLCLDLDDFKDVNDGLGHPAGDALLREVATRILSITRQSDIVARLGGDEFAIVARRDDDAGVVLMAARLVEAIRAPYEIDGQMVIISTSIGIAMAPADGINPDTLMKAADLALYRAKSSGRGCYAFFEPSMEQHLVDRRRVEVELRNALAMGEFELHYQPVLKVATRRVIGFEALIRWRHATRGLVPPGEFIPIAEENGLIVQIGEWALNQACAEAASWPGSHIKIAVNLSPVQFQTGNLVGTIAAALEASGLAPDRLELEITESTVMRDADAALITIKDIKALGVRLAMDDFGTGYSSLAYLQKFPFDKVKIDRAFIRDGGQATNRAIIRAVTSIAESLGIDTTAEGVETEAQFVLIAEQGCSEAQGFLFGAARPASEILAMLSKENSSASAGLSRILDGRPSSARQTPPRGNTRQAPSDIGRWHDAGQR